MVSLTLETISDCLRREGLSHVTQQAKFGIKTTHVIPKDKAEISHPKRALSTSCVYLGLLIILRHL